MSLQDITACIENGKSKQIEELINAALEEGIEPGKILTEGMIAAMANVGDRFQAGEAFVPEMLLAAKAMKKGVKVLKPHLASDALGSLGKFIIGTVEGDLHDIGKNLVAMMIESAGFEVIDLGVDVSADAFVQALNENPDCKIVGLSSLLTTTMPSMKSAVEAIRAMPNGNEIIIMVGGAPVSQEFCDEIGANYYTTDAGAAAVKAKEIAQSIA